MTARKKDNMSQLNCIVIVKEVGAAEWLINLVSDGPEWSLELPPAYNQPGRYYYTYEGGKWVFVRREDV